MARSRYVVSLGRFGLSLEEVRSRLDRPDSSPLEVIDLQLARLREWIEMQRSLCERPEAITAR